MEVIGILPYPPQLQEEHKDPYVHDNDNSIIQRSVVTFVFKTLLYSADILVKNIGVMMLFLELWRIGEDDDDLHDGS